MVDNKCRRNEKQVFVSSSVSKIKGKKYKYVLSVLIVIISVELFRKVNIRKKKKDNYLGIM